MPDQPSIRARARSEATGIGIVLAAAALLIFANLGGPIYEVRDVARYAQMILEMRESGTLVPTLMSRPYHEAMPLATWAPYASSELLGELSPFAVRLPSALAWFATIALTIVIGRRASSRVGLIAGAAMTVNYLTLEYARGSRVEGILALAVTAAIAAFVVAGTRHGYRRLAWYVVAGVAAALGFAAKGPYAMVLIVAAVGPFVLVERRWRERLGGMALAGVVAGAVTVAWVLPYVEYLGPAGARAFFDQMLLRETVQKFVSGYGKAEPLFAYVIAVPMKLAPWSVPALAALLVICRRKHVTTPTEILSASWLIAPLVLLSLASGKHIRYVVPLVPALALLAAVEIDAWLASPSARVQALMRRGTLALAALLLVVGVVAPTVFVSLFGWSAWGLGTCAVTVVAATYAWVLARRGRVPAAMLSAHVGLAAVVAFVFAAVFALPERAESSSDHYRLAAQLEGTLLPTERVFVVADADGALDPHQLALYLDGHDISYGRGVDAPAGIPVLTTHSIDGYRLRGAISWQDEPGAPASLLMEPDVRVGR